MFKVFSYIVLSAEESNTTSGPPVLVSMIAQMLSARQTLEKHSSPDGLNIDTKLNSECKCCYFVQDLCEYRKTA